MEIIIDTREKEIRHILKYMPYLSINCIYKKIDAGDYSFTHKDIDYSNEFVIERKANLDELALNFTKHRKRFKEEFERAKENNCTIILLIEDDFNKIKKHEYRSKFHPNAFLASLQSWRKKELIAEIYFGKKEKTAEFMLKLFENYLKDKGIL